eukprot:COSAG06_NODE_52818_length_303_cov_1.333333_1_plen_48_part_10
MRCVLCHSREKAFVASFSRLAHSSAYDPPPIPEVVDDAEAPATVPPPD